MASQTPTRIILDCDPGIDDSFALAMILAAPQISLVATTSVFGAVPLQRATANLLGLLDLGGRTDIPVYAGCAAAWTENSIGRGVPHAHGFDGLADVGLLAASARGEAKDDHAALALGRLGRQDRKQDKVVVVTLGPLTNLCCALKLNPDLDLLIERIIVMGGNLFGPGNHTIAAETNVFSDPEAAALVFAARWRVSLIGSDVTSNVTLVPEQIARIAGRDSFAGMLITRLGPFFREYTIDATKRDEIGCHSLATIAALIAPDLFTFVERRIAIETQGISRGKTWGMPLSEMQNDWDAPHKPSHVEVCSSVEEGALSEAIEAVLMDG